MRGGLCGIVSFFIKKYDLERSREVVEVGITLVLL
jgi:hypothetical protein